MVSKNYALISILSKKYKILKKDLKERTESFCDKIFKAAAILDKKLKILKVESSLFSLLSVLVL